MDKENNSIDDILKLLKDTVKNTETNENSEPLSVREDSALDTESLKEKLREQYAYDGSASTEGSEGNEYALDESFIEKNESEEEPFVADNSTALPSDNEEISEDISVVDEEIENVSDNENATAMSFDDSDDVPWYEDDNDSVKRVTIKPQIEKEEYTFEDEYVEIENDTSENSEQSIEDAEVTDFLESNFPNQEEQEDGESFYRTITEAEHETLAKRAAMRELDELMVEDNFSDDTSYDGEYDFSDDEAGQTDEELKSHPDRADVDNNEQKYGISEEFYGASGYANEFGGSQTEPQKIAVQNEPFEDVENTENVQKILKVSLWQSIKPIFLGIIVLFILILEVLPIFEIVPGGLLDYTEFPAIYLLIDLQLLLFISVLCGNSLLDGFSRLMSHIPNTYSVLFVTIAISIVYTLISCFCAENGMPHLYNFIPAAYLLISYILESLDKRRVNRSVGTLLVGNGVYTLSRSQGKNSCADKMYLGGVAPDTNIYEPCEVKGSKYEGAFAKDREYVGDKTVIHAITPISIFSALMAVGAMVIGETFGNVINSMIVTFILLAPLSAIVSNFLPIYISYKRLYERGCIITGHKAAQSISDCDAIVFGDRHLFSECNPKDSGIKLYNEKTAKELLGCLNAIYSAIGGPMENIFSGVDSYVKKRKVNMIRIAKNGFEAIVDDRVNMIVGTSEYLMRYGISVDAKAGAQQGVLFVAMNLVLSAKISLNYKTEPLFERLCEFLGDNGIETVIHTYDPVISGGYVAKCRKSDGFKYPISVVHKNRADYYSTEKLSTAANKTGVFAIASRLKLVELIVFCKKIVKIDKLNSYVRIASFTVMAVLSSVLTVSGNMQNFNLIWVLLHQAILCAIYTVISVKLLPQSFDNM